MSAADVTRRLPTGMVACSGTILLSGQRLERVRPYARCERSILTTKRVPGEVGFILMSAMADSPYFEAPP